MRSLNSRPITGSRGQDASEQYHFGKVTERVAAEDTDGTVDPEELLIDKIYGEVQRLHDSLTDANGRYVSEGFGAELRRLKAQLDCAVASYWNNVHKLMPAVTSLLSQLEELLYRFRNDNVKMFMSAPKNAISERSQVAIVNAVEVQRDNWTEATFARKQKELSARGVPATLNKNQFSMTNPTFYKCKRCFSDNHTLAQCPQDAPTCCTCRRVGHCANSCIYNLCPHCYIYGHSRRKCPTWNLPPACSKCGQRTHLHSECTTPRLYCYLCGNPHRTHHCLKYINTEFYGMCFPHKGAHTYANCPKKRG